VRLEALLAHGALEVVVVAARLLDLLLAHVGRSGDDSVRLARGTASRSTLAARLWVAPVLDNWIIVAKTVDLVGVASIKAGCEFSRAMNTILEASCCVAVSLSMKKGRPRVWKFDASKRCRVL
jgi:hypothetical protein